MAHILLFEPGLAGHRLGWIRIILAEFRRKRAGSAPPAHLTVAAPEALLSGLGAPSALWESEGVALLPLAPAVSDPVWGLTQTLTETEPDVLLLLELTPWERFLARRKLPCPIAGILFVQYPEIDPTKGPLSRRVERWLRRWRKAWLTSRWLRRQDWREVFLLNGERACDVLNRRFPDHPVFRPVPDPMVSGGRRSEVGGRKEEGVIRFSHPGVLSKRKGMEVALRALELVSDEWCSRCELLILGRAEDDYRARFAGALARLRRRRPNARVEWREEYLSDADFEESFQSAHWIVMPYLRPEYSSGILVHAAAAGVPVLGPSDGLLGRLIEEYSLGRTCDVQPHALAAALEDSVRRPFQGDADRREAFVRRSDPAEFGKRILEACLR